MQDDERKFAIIEISEKGLALILSHGIRALRQRGAEFGFDIPEGAKVIRVRENFDKGLTDILLCDESFPDTLPGEKFHRLGTEENILFNQACVTDEVYGNDLLLFAETLANDVDNILTDESYSGAVCELICARILDKFNPEQ